MSRTAHLPLAAGALLLLGACATPEPYPMEIPHCAAAASTEITDPEAVLYDFTEPASALLAHGQGEFVLGLQAPEGTDALDEATLILALHGAAVAYDGEPSQPGSGLSCADWIEAPVSVSLVSTTGLLDEQFEATLILDEVEGASLQIRTPADAIEGSLDLTGPFADSALDPDRFELDLKLDRAPAGDWAGELWSVAITSEPVTDCPDEDPDVDADCPAETEHYRELASLNSP